MDLESIMPREISQTENDKNHIISLTCGMCNSKQQMNKQNKFTDTENSTMATRASRGWGKMKKVKGIEYTVTEGDWTVSDEHTMQYTDDIYGTETYIA